MCYVNHSAIDACPAPAGIKVATTPRARLYDLQCMQTSLSEDILRQRKQQTRGMMYYILSIIQDTGGLLLYDMQQYATPALE